MNEKNISITAGKTWLGKPDEVNPVIAGWKRNFSDIVRIDEAQQFTGDTIYAITVTSKNAGKKRNILFGVPHAHEPAGTAAAMGFLNEIITGQRLDKTASILPREKILQEVRLTFIPLGNPYGRKRAPVDWWDGSKYSNEEFESIMIGRLMGNPSGKLANTFWHYHYLFNQVVERLEEIGIVWEQIGDELYAEPHFYKGCGFGKLIDRLSDEFHYDLFIELHQGMEEGENMDTLVIHPREDWVPQRSVAIADQVESCILAKWAEAGATPYPADPDYYRRSGRARLPDFDKPAERGKMSIDWLALKSGTPSLTIEVQNNNPRTPADEQLFYQQTAIEACVEFLLNN